MQSQRKQRSAARSITTDAEPTGASPAWRVPRLPGMSPWEHLLIQVAHQAGIDDPELCAVILSLISEARNVRRLLDATLSNEALTETRVTTLLTLYALEPIPCSPTDLAYHAEVSRSSMTAVLDDLQGRGWIVRPPRAEGDRRSRTVQLTHAGQEATQLAVQRFLQTASVLAADLEPKARRTFTESCVHLHDRARATLAR